MNSTLLAYRRPLKAWACAAGLCLAVMGAPGCSRTIVEAPPPPQTEVITESPGADFIWVGGYWGWSWGRYVWIGGHWERPDHPHAVWVGPNWEHRGDRYVFVQGYWR